MQFQTPPDYVPAKRRVYRNREKPVRIPPAPPTEPLVLVAGFYQADEAYVMLSFDRAVDISAIDGSKIRVDDPFDGMCSYLATGYAQQISDTMIQLGLVEDGPTSASDVLLNVTAANGIVAVNDGGPWAGVSDQSLPFP